MDHTSQGWYCDHLYMHDGCVAGYVCDSSAGQCVLSDPGEGDTLDNCNADCRKDPEPETKYACDVTTFQCVNATSGSDSATCDASCASETPSALVGLWRGLNVQTGFTMGEILMNFTSSGVTYGAYPLGSGAFPAREATVASVGPSLLRLTFTAPEELVGIVKVVSYSSPGWPTGPESRGASFAVPRDDTHAAAPSDVLNAMGDTSFDVYSMQQCNPWQASSDLCDFSPAFTAEAAEAAESALGVTFFKNQVKGNIKNAAAAAVALRGAKKNEKDAAAAAAVQDSCFGFADCDNCLAGGDTCGWCDGTIVDTSGTIVCGSDGFGCCGGDDGFSFCNVTYRKTCPVVCDWTDWTNPSCRSATTPEIQSDDVQTVEDCDAMPWCTAETYQYCDETGSQTCQTLYSKDDCDAEPQCDSTNATCDSSVCQKTSYIWCSSSYGCQSSDDPAVCEADPECDPDAADGGSCNPSECAAPTYWTCSSDDGSYQCKMGTGPKPVSAFNSSDACEAACVDKDVSGVWRGLRIDSGFQADEWDFYLASSAESGAYNKAITYKSKATGAAFTGTYSVGDTIADADYASAAAITVTLSSGDVLTGIVSVDDSDNTAKGPVTKFMYLGLPKASTATAKSFAGAMSEDKEEWVLMACLADIETGCDFSSADPSV